jgi:CRISPR-associated DxTHG motif protein
MPTKAISFLGYTKANQPYRETIYTYRGDECTTPFMAEATAHFFRGQIEALLVLVTKEAQQQNFADLERRFTGSLKPTPISISSGTNEEQLWKIFAVISEQIMPGDTIIFDITNGFRSLPVLALLATSYLRVVRGATVSHMVYGAYDASKDGKTPVFELTPFLSLLDWTTATDAFLKYGRADDLTQLVQAHSDYTKLGDTLKKLTAALQTSRPSEVMETASRLHTEIAQSRQATSAAAQPFGLLLDRIAAEYTPLGMTDAVENVLARDILLKQHEMIQWYVGKGLYVQAITLAREWLVSWVIAHQPAGDIFDKTTRDYADAAINGYREATISGRRGKERQPVPPAMYQVAQTPLVQQLWNKTRDLRNDLGHTGMRKDPRTALKVESEVREACGQLHQLLSIATS